MCYNFYVSVSANRVELAVLLGDTKSELSLPLKFGLGAGLYFEYFQTPHGSPSRRISGINRNLATNLNARIARYQSADAAHVLRQALQENALLFNLDRAPTAALMGMEMLAEHLSDFATVSDWQAGILGLTNEIRSTNALYRETYLQFLQEIGSQLDTAELTTELSEIVQEWNAFAEQLADSLHDAAQLEHASRMLRRLAFREEHFWGNVLQVAGSS